MRNIPVIPDEDFFTALDIAVTQSVPKPTAVVLNYPNNPTTAMADLDFYERVVDYCRHHKIYILSDLAYAEVYFDGPPPPSILQVKGARDVAVEFTSMSKTYSMPGWRIGFATGNKNLISALSRIKSYLDYGAFTPIQVAATAALNGPQDCVDQMRQLYRERRDVLIDSMSQAGWEIPSPPSTMFASSCSCGTRFRPASVISAIRGVHCQTSAMITPHKAEVPPAKMGVLGDKRPNP